MRAHLGVVHQAVSAVAARLPRHVRRDDLVSAGMLGLAEAARAYDAGRGVPFDRFASRRVRGAILDELRSHDWASRSVRARARHIDLWADALAHELGRTPTPEELAGRLGVDRAALARTRAEVRRASVGHLEPGPSEERRPEEQLPSPDATTEELLVDRERRGYLTDAIAALPERLRLVVVASFFDGRRMADIAEDLGVTESRVSQLRTEALGLLRDALDAHLGGRPPAAGGSARADRRRAAYVASVGARSDLKRRLERGSLLLAG